MRRLMVVVGALALAMVGCGDGGDRRVTTSAIEEPAAGGTTVHGVVFRGGMPVGGGQVLLVGPDSTPRSVTTGPGGDFTLPGVPPGRYELVASADSGVSCPSEGCISATWAERSDVMVAGEPFLRLDVDGD